MNACEKEHPFLPTGESMSGQLKQRKEAIIALSDRQVVNRNRWIARNSFYYDDSCDLHDLHRGQLKSTSHASHGTLDDALEKINVCRVDFVKLDVDGNELSVLRGARNTLARHRPTLLLEIAPYVFDDPRGHTIEILGMLTDCGYVLRTERRNRELPADVDKLLLIIPHGSGINVFCSPSV